MIVDSSAVAAILFKEPDAQRLRDAITRASQCWISVANVLKLVIVLSARNRQTGAEPVRNVLNLFKIVEVPIALEHGSMAVQAFLKYGKGRHPARLNFGDCFSYALAKSLDEPLLFKGDDFSKTDVKIA